MCGIFGKLGDSVTREGLERMSHALAHRGPDDEGFYLAQRVGLGSRRLAILDVAGGHQPLANEDGSVWVAYNGEIYNFRELRRDLEGRGHRFRTRSDTEVIVHLYEELGPRAVERLRGMFAFAIWDDDRRQLVLARDRLGQKPLFYTHDTDGSFLFASEIKALLAASGLPRELDLEAMHHYLSLRFVPPPRTMLRGIRKLPPAHVLIHRDGASRIERYWRLSFRDKLEASDAELASRLEEKLAETVDAHLVSDVPVGAFLSGGMDSSMIVALMARADRPPFATFAIGVAATDFNELPHARKVAEHCHTRHVEKVVEADLVSSLPQMIWHLDEPSDPIAACMFQAAALAAGEVKVVLGGDGGDELFAGFDRYLGVPWVERFACLPAALRDAAGAVLTRLPDSFTYKSLAQKARWVDQLARSSDLASRYAEATCFFRFNHQAKRELFADALWHDVAGIDSAEEIARPMREAPAVDPLDRMLYTDYMTRLPEHSLMLTDRMSMAHGLEQRSPLLDHQLVELLAAYPARFKIRGRRLKHGLRRLAADYLPESILRRGKQGFMLPVAYWFRGELASFLERTLLDSYFVRAGLFRREQVERLLVEHRAHADDHHVRLWMLLNLEIWHRLYLEGREPEDLTAEIRQTLGRRS